MFYSVALDKKPAFSGPTRIRNNFAQRHTQTKNGFCVLFYGNHWPITQENYIKLQFVFKRALISLNCENEMGFTMTMVAISR